MNHTRGGEALPYTGIRSTERLTKLRTMRNATLQAED